MKVDFLSFWFISTMVGMFMLVISTFLFFRGKKRNVVIDDAKRRNKSDFFKSDKIKQAFLAASFIGMVLILMSIYGWFSVLKNFVSTYPKWTGLLVLAFIVWLKTVKTSYEDFKGFVRGVSYVFWISIVVWIFILFFRGKLTHKSRSSEVCEQKAEAVEVSPKGEMKKKSLWETFCAYSARKPKKRKRTEQKEASIASFKVKEDGGGSSAEDPVLLPEPVQHGQVVSSDFLKKVKKSEIKLSVEGRDSDDPQKMGYFITTIHTPELKEGEWIYKVQGKITIAKNYNQKVIASYFRPFQNQPLGGLVLVKPNEDCLYLGDKGNWPKGVDHFGLTINVPLAKSLFDSLKGEFIIILEKKEGT